MYQEQSARATTNEDAFFVYLDADSGLNHRFPSGLIGNLNLRAVAVNPACIDGPTTPSGCSDDLTRLDGTHIRKCLGYVLPGLADRSIKSPAELATNAYAARLAKLLLNSTPDISTVWLPGRTL